MNHDSSYLLDVSARLGISLKLSDIQYTDLNDLEKLSGVVFKSISCVLNFINNAQTLDGDSIDKFLDNFGFSEKLNESWSLLTASCRQGQDRVECFAEEVLNVYLFIMEEFISIKARCEVFKIPLDSMTREQTPVDPDGLDGVRDCLSVCWVNDKRSRLSGLFGGIK